MKALFLVAPLLCGFTVERVSSSLNGATWANPNVTYYVDSSGISSISGDADISAVYEAFAAWNTVSCSTFRFVDGGLTSGNPAGNLIKFVHSAASWAGPADAIAYTARFSTSGVITSADMFVNDFSLPWATNDDLHAYDVQSVITHELGHALGLQHSADPRATMYFAGRRGRTFFRTLSDDDRAGVCFLYPAASTLCGDNSACPMLDNTSGSTDQATVCSGGSCIAGQRGYGEDCFGDSGCSGGTTCVRFDLSPPTVNTGLCTKACPCPGSDVCDGTQCAPHNANCDSSCGSGINETCDVDVDGGFACQHICLTNANCNTGASEFCFDPVDAGNAGLCRTRGATANGQPCTAPGECNSLVCGVGLDGNAACVDPNASPPPPDSGGNPDGGAPDGGGPDGGDSGATIPPDGSTGLGDDPFTDKEGVGGGCAAAMPSILILMGAIVVALGLRRFLREDSRFQSES